MLTIFSKEVGIFFFQILIGTSATKYTWIKNPKNLCQLSYKISSRFLQDFFNIILNTSRNSGCIIRWLIIIMFVSPPQSKAFEKGIMKKNFPHTNPCTNDAQFSKCRLQYSKGKSHATVCSVVHISLNDCQTTVV